MKDFSRKAKSGVWGAPVLSGLATAALVLAAAPVFAAPGAGHVPQAEARAAPAVPKFSHVLVIFLENREFDEVVGNRRMPRFNRLAGEFTLLTRYFGVSHPSLPNYLALVGGDTFGVRSDCMSCYVDAPSLPDLLETRGMTWKTYQESLPRAGYTGDISRLYAKKHNPFVYFNAIRRDRARLRRSVVPLTDLAGDLASGRLPDFAFIEPNLCNSGHDCGPDVADAWLGRTVDEILGSQAFDANSLLVITWDEGSTNASCCGTPPLATGGRLAAVVVSPLVRPGFEDATPYSHYSVLKTIEEAWGLERLGRTSDQAVNLITAPWK